MSNSTTRLIRWGLGIVSALALGGATYFSIDNARTIDQLDESVAEVVSLLDRNSANDDGGGDDAIPDDGALPSEEELTGANNEDPVEDPNAAGAGGDAEKELVLILPDPATFVVTANSKQIVIGLNNQTSDDLEALKVRFLVISKKVGANFEIMNQGYKIVKNGQVVKGEQQTNLTLEFDRLPPTGEYKAWVLVSGAETAPLSEEVTLQVASYASQSIQFRTGSNGEAVSEITISGVSYYPGFLGVPDDVRWDPYEFQVWHENVADLEGVNLRFLTSELASDKSGRSGHLSVTPVEHSLSGWEKTEILIEPEDLEVPEEYQGSITIYSEDGSDKASLEVTARVRDFLIWPFAVILFAALLIGWLVRMGTRDTTRNVGFQRLLIANARDNLAALPCCHEGVPNPECGKIKKMLLLADSSLGLGDFTTTKAYLNTATTRIAQLRLMEHRVEVAKLFYEREKRALALKHDAHSVEEQLYEAQAQLAKAKKEFDEGFIDGAMAKLDDFYTEFQRAKELLKGDGVDEAEGENAPSEQDICIKLPKSATAGERVKATLELGKYQPEQVSNVVLTVGGKVEEPSEQTRYEYDIDTACKEQDAGKAFPRKIIVSAKVTFDDNSVRPKTYKATLLVYLPYQVVPDGGGGQYYSDQPVKLTLLPPASGSPLTWKSHRLRIVPGTGKSAEECATDQPFVFDPKNKAGDYQIVVLQDLNLVAAIVLTVSESPFSLAVKKFNRTTWLTIGAWALVASVAGIVYISASLPTFGSALDYFLALAWAFGLSSGAVPVEGIAKKIYDVLVPPENGQPSTTTTTTDDKKVPKLTEMTLKAAKSEAEKADLKVTPAMDEKNQDLKVIKQKPKEGDPIPTDKTIKLTLEQSLQEPTQPSKPLGKAPDLAKALKVVFERVGLVVNEQNPGVGQGLSDDKTVTLMMNQSVKEKLTDIQKSVKDQPISNEWVVRSVEQAGDDEKKLVITLAENEGMGGGDA